jgi:hypothetical protein
VCNGIQGNHLVTIKQVSPARLPGAPPKKAGIFQSRLFVSVNHF